MPVNCEEIMKRYGKCGESLLKGVGEKGIVGKMG
jgi:hypothetical protein